VFANREDAGRQLVTRFETRQLCNPLILAIPRGGLPVGAMLARGLNAELDVVLSRKIPAPGQPELAIGAISEDGQVYLNPYALDLVGRLDDYLVSECRHQMAEINRRRALFRMAHPQSRISGRSIIVTDDGIATGSTMIAALQTVKSQKPKELIAAVPVASAERLQEVGRYCDEVICLQIPENFGAVGEFYRDFTQVEDHEAVRLLKDFNKPRQAAGK
jgi:putative phosphoribosyl transferase